MQEQLEALEAVLGCEIDGAFSGAIWAPLHTLIVVVSELIGDAGEALGWFIWDNECGTKALKSTMPDQSVKQIETVHDLLDVMGY